MKLKVFFSIKIKFIQRNEKVYLYLYHHKLTFLHQWGICMFETRKKLLTVMDMSKKELK